ncbi:MAG: HAMP domain-containing histidine kinase [Microscillaceae bacterium]|jgi:hypothetical protein|nr:HAMP domain-containing histidine kinase [Microscillaceae bacterium]
MESYNAKISELSITRETKMDMLAQGAPIQKTNAILEALRDNYSTLVGEGEVVMLIINDLFRINFMSNSICEVLHYPEKSLLNESVFSLLVADSPKKIKDAVYQISHQPGKAYPLKDLALYCALGNIHYFDGLLINLIQDERVGGYLFYLHNISERRKIENQLKDLNLELDSFVYKASHDLRAPLSSLAGLIYLTESEFPQAAKENFDLMKHSVQKLDKFIQQLAHYSRNNYVNKDWENIKLKSFVLEVIESYKYLDKAEKIHFELEIADNQSINTDAFRLRVILGNLISNAIKYHQIDQERPFLKLKLETSNDFYIIIVEDNGIGISLEYQSKIFDMFTRATTISDGSGLGLYIVKKALEKLKGQIHVQSTRGEGSLFKVQLPIPPPQRR